MAVYTQLGEATLAELVGGYDVGALISAREIAEGISNSNWVVETTGSDNHGARFILTLYERRIDERELPFFLALLDHLAAQGCTVPATIHDRQGNSLRTVAGKAAALIEFLPGHWPQAPSPAQAHSVGAALAKVHLAAGDFSMTRRDRLDPASNLETLLRCGRARLSAIDPQLACAVDWADEVVRDWPSALPRSIIHSDLFPDNVLMIGNEVTGLIDFYFACEGMMAYDLAVTHAAWSFDNSGTHYAPAIGASLVAGYESVRLLGSEEHAALPMLAQGACLRFAASRAEDWLEAPGGLDVMRKDPMDFMRRWQFYRERGGAVFAKP